MENNNFQKIEEKIKDKLKIIEAIFFIIFTCIIISTWSNLFNNIKTIKEEQKAEEEKSILVEQNNSQIDLLTQIDNSFFSKKLEYLEFEQNIKIPLPNHLIEENIVSCKKCIESNEIAHESYVVKITYGIEKANTNMILDIFKERLPEDHNYEQVYYYDDYGTRIYTREENEEYFSYIIFRGAEVTYGVCYGEPKIKNI